MAKSPSVRAESVHSDYINRSHSRLESHILCDKEMRNLKLEVSYLHRRLRRGVHKRENITPSLSQSSSSEGVQSYRRSSKSPLIEFFIISFCSIGGKSYHRRRVNTPPLENMGNDAMGRALHQISRSPFSSGIVEVELPHRFTQPTFTI